MHILFSYLAVFCLLFAPAVRAAHAESFAGKVVGVVDGDTIVVMRNGSPKRVRLDGVDSPEMGQDYGIRARRLVLALTGGRKVTVECKGTDDYGRILADVILSGRIILNREIVRAGYAWHYRSKDELLELLQVNAREKRMGLWAGKEPVAPWIYRHWLRKHAEEKTSGSGIQPFIAVSAPSEQTVYVTKTGKKYHRASCRSLRKGRIPMTLEEAVEKGYKPCGICKPPSPDLSGSDPTLPSPVPAVKQGQPSIAAGSLSGQTVYVTKTGKKYHRAGCRSLRKGRIPMTLEEAAQKGYEPCGICRPPSLNLLGSGSPSPEAEGKPPRK